MSVEQMTTETTEAAERARRYLRHATVNMGVLLVGMVLTCVARIVASLA